MPLQGSTPDVSTWLAELGLAQYASLFVENHVDAKLLPTLTDNDLRELGVTSFGHRKKMLQAIACLNAPPSEPPLSAPSPTTGPERRQLTVLFVDLVASTELATHLDPEDMSDIWRLWPWHRGSVGWSRPLGPQWRHASASRPAWSLWAT